MRRQAQSSESDLSEDENQFRITANPHNVRDRVDRKYNESSESDISSLSEEQQEVSEKRYQDVGKNNKQTIRQQSESDSQSQSEQSSGIDHIEQRIRRLQNDLEDKIDRQKTNQNPRREQSQSSQKKQQPKVPIKSVNPPLPTKKIAQSQSNTEGGYIRSLTNSSENKNNANISANKSDINQKPNIKTVKRQQNFEEIYVQKPSNKFQNRTIEEKMGPISQTEKMRQKSKQHMQEANNNALLKQAYHQISQMQKVIEQLRKENLQLKQQLTKKDKKQKKHQSQEIQILKMGAGSQNLKLQKQIQTLKALQSLQKKLKKSIAKKQKLQGNKNSSVVHLGNRKV